MPAGLAIDHRQEIGEFLDDFVGGGNEKFRVRVVGLGVPDEEAARGVKAFLEAVYDRSVIKGIAAAVKREAAAPSRQSA